MSTPSLTDCVKSFSRQASKYLYIIFINKGAYENKPKDITTDIRKLSREPLVCNAIMIQYSNLNISNTFLFHYQKLSLWSAQKRSLRYRSIDLLLVSMWMSVNSNILTQKLKWITAEWNLNLLMFLIADSNKSDLFGGFRKRSLSTIVSTPAFLRKDALWIVIKPSSTTSSRGAGGGCKPQYRFLGTYKSQFEPLYHIHTAQPSNIWTINMH